MPYLPESISMEKVMALVRLADSAGFSQPQQYFSLTQNQPSHQPTSQPTVFSSHAKSASQLAS